MLRTGVAIGFNVETVQFKNIKFQVWDLGGEVISLCSFDLFWIKSVLIGFITLVFFFLASRSIQYPVRNTSILAPLLPIYNCYFLSLTLIGPIGGVTLQIRRPSYTLLTAQISHGYKHPEPNFLLFYQKKS